MSQKGGTALFLLLCLAGCAPIVSTPQASSNQTEQTILLGGSKNTRYLLYLPQEYERGGEPWPLILFLHGGGEAGGDLSLVKREGLPRLLEQGKHLPFVVVSPQSARKAWSIPDLILFLDEIKRTHRVDRERIYATGLSTGAYASWLLAIHHPDRIAAIAPVTTHKKPPDICKMKSVPAWAFHNAGDGRAPPSVTRKIVEALEACGGEVKLTIYPRKGHDAWSETYGRPDLYEWFLKHHREDRARHGPAVTSRSRDPVLARRIAQHVNEFSNDADFVFRRFAEHDWGESGVERLEGDGRVLPGAVFGQGSLAAVALDGVAASRFGVVNVGVLGEDDLALAGAFDRAREEAIGAVRNPWLHGFADDLRDEHARPELSHRIRFYPLLRMHRLRT